MHRRKKSCLSIQHLMMSVRATQIVSLVTCADGGNTRLVVQGVYVGETTISD